MRAKCPYCDREFDSRGVKRHVVLSHPNMAAEFGTAHASPIQGKGIRKELLVPETPKENAWVNGLKRRSTKPGASKLTLVRSENSIDPWKVKNMTDTPTVNPNSSTPPEKKYSCGQCGLQMDEVSWDDEDPCCPRCNTKFEMDEL